MQPPLLPAIASAEVATSLPGFGSPGSFANCSPSCQHVYRCTSGPDPPDRPKPSTLENVCYLRKTCSSTILRGRTRAKHTEIARTNALRRANLRTDSANILQKYSNPEQTKHSKTHTLEHCLSIYHASAAGLGKSWRPMPISVEFGRSSEFGRYCAKLARCWTKLAADA